MQKKITVKAMVICAMSIALATVLSMIKVYEFPFGGAITAFSMLFICLPGLLYGLPLGLISGLVYGILQFILGPYVVHPVQVILDYGLAFAALGLSGLFYGKKNSESLGYLVGITGRLIFSAISGFVFFAEYAWEGWSPIAYAFAYNAAYIYAEGLITLIILQLPAVKEGLNTIRKNTL